MHRPLRVPLVGEDAPGIKGPCRPGMSDDFPGSPLGVGAQVRLQLRLPLPDVPELEVRRPRCLVRGRDRLALEAFDPLEERGPAIVRRVVAV